MFFVDGTVLEMHTPEILSMKRGFYNPKHKIASHTFTILVTEDGKIVNVTKTYPGNTHDRKMFFKEKLGEQLIEAYGEEMSKKERGEVGAWNLAVGGDKGYPGIMFPADWTLYITKSGETSGEPGDWDDTTKIDETDKFRRYVDFDEVEHSFKIWKTTTANGHYYNGALAVFRSVVERTFAWVKDWAALSNLYFTSGSPETLELGIDAICALVNYTH